MLELIFAIALPAIASALLFYEGSSSGGLRKSIMITCDDKDAICHFITGELQKGATIVEATGAYTNEKRYLIFTTLTRKQAAVLRSFIHQNKLHAFISMSSTSEVFGKGFTSI